MRREAFVSLSGVLPELFYQSSAFALSAWLLSSVQCQRPLALGAMGTAIIGNT